MSKTIKIFDTTLRDGEQSPGCSMNLKEKIQVAKQLEKLGVDIIEAGFAIASPGDFQSVSEIARVIKNATVASQARATTKDIDAAYEAVKNAVSPRIHTFIATSPIHMEYKLKMTSDKVLEQAVEMVKYAKKYVVDVEFSAEDASRSDMDFLCTVVEAVINAGATVVNLPDTVGYTTPEEYYKFIHTVMSRVPNIGKADVSVHCHNDLGLGVANSLAAVMAGATQVECTVNGIGERAGNAALEEIVMGLKTRKDIYGADTKINTRQILSSSRLISSITGAFVQANKAIVGVNAFAHESGIHQHGMLANKETYEIMTPETVGYVESKLVLGKHSGRHAFENWLDENGHSIPKDEIDELFAKFKDLADKKKEITELDLNALVTSKSAIADEKYKLNHFVINSGNSITSTSIISLDTKGGIIEDVAIGDGPVDASFNAINKMANIDVKLDDYSIRSVTQGKDALGEAMVQITDGDKKYRGRGLSTDIVEASILAYINAVNKLAAENNNL